MNLRLVPATAACAAIFLLSGAAPTPEYLLSLQLRTGDRLVEHSDLIDRIDWWLPHERLEAFRAQGIVINEEVRTSIVANGVVIRADGTGAAIRSRVVTTVRDIPRNHVGTSHDAGIATVTLRNSTVRSSVYAIENAPMVDLPPTPVHLGSRWTTHERVLTSLGSGTATFAHVVGDVEGSLVRVDVVGRGTITGKEYNLPSLLPGTIALHGSSFFDTASGLVVQESYRVENSLIKPARSERIGFTEVLDIATDLHKESRSVGRINSSAPYERNSNAQYGRLNSAAPKRGSRHGR